MVEQVLNTILAAPPLWILAYELICIFIITRCVDFTEDYLYGGIFSIWLFTVFAPGLGEMVTLLTLFALTMSTVSLLAIPENRARIRREWMT